MKKKTLTRIAAACLTIPLILLSACTKKPEPLEEKEKDTPYTDGSLGLVNMPDDGSDTEKAEVNVSTLVDITSEDELWDFLAGDWRLYDPVGDCEYATLSIDENGELEFIRDFDDASLDGDFSIKKHRTYDPDKDELFDDPWFTDFEIDVAAIPNDFALPDLAYDLEYGEETDGNFMIARGDGRDYLKMQWIGNGDSVFFEVVLQNLERIREEKYEKDDYTLQQDWLFIRENSGTETGKPEISSDFYGFIWDRDKDGSLWIQSLEPHKYDSEDEYTGTKFIEGFFTENGDIGLANYETVSSSDTSLVFHDSALAKPHPLLMCRFVTDEKGRIKEISEVDRAYYGAYDFGLLDQEYSYDGVTFTVNGRTFDLREEYDSAVNAIMDMYRVGDWIVVDGHVNPHVGIYFLVNIYTGNIEKAIEGANLTWRGDDLTTAVYSRFSEVFDFKDNIIGMTDGAEVSDLSFDRSGTVVKAEDFDNGTYEFEIGEGDEAMYRYSDFRVQNKAESWKSFIENAPENALAFIMINPPQDVKSRLPYVEDTGEGSDCIYIVALKDDTKIRLDKGEFDLDSMKFKAEETCEEYVKNKGDCIGYSLTVPEGIPNRCIYVSCGDKSAEYPVSPISGKYDICGEFITISK